MPDCPVILPPWPYTLETHAHFTGSSLCIFDRDCIAPPRISNMAKATAGCSGRALRCAGPVVCSHDDHRVVARMLCSVDLEPTRTPDRAAGYFRKSFYKVHSNSRYSAARVFVCFYSVENARSTKRKLSTSDDAATRRTDRNHHTNKR